MSARNAKIQSVEGKLKQRELTLNQRQEDLQRKNCEVDAVKENLAAQLELVDKKKLDLENFISGKSNNWKPFPDFLQTKQKND